jgi:predicted O-linked N-acetylglucosamine transferase (SPINDLY family)
MKNKPPWGAGPVGVQPSMASARAGDVKALLGQAVAFHRAGLLGEAEKLYRGVLAVQPKNFDGLHLLGVIYHQRGECAEAIRQIDAALKINPRSADAHNNRGNALSELKRFEEALASYNRAIAIRPVYAEALVSRANALQELKKFDEALTSCERAIALRPDYAEASYNRGNALAALKRFGDARLAYDRAITLKPNYVEAFNNRGAALQEIGQFDLALADFDRAIALKPDHAQAFNNRGFVLSELRRFDEAVVSFDKAIAIAPNYADAYNNRGTAWQDLKQLDMALASFDQAIEHNPHNADARYNRATTLQGLGRLEEAVAGYDETLTLDADVRQLQGSRLHAKMHLCQWRDFDRDCARLLSSIEKRNPAAHPFALLAIGSSPAQQLKCAEVYAEATCRAAPEPLWRGERYEHDRIRVAYLSADLHDHATAHLMAGQFERHDRSRFETIALSFGPARDSDMRQRLMRSFDRFIDVRMQSDQAIAELVRAMEIDIAVDLKGFTQEARPRIFAQRPAPVQVSYIGYPGTMGARYIDYIIADHFVISDDRQAAYSEKIVRLPGSYQVNDADRRMSATIPSRASAGLPEEGFVFCCFNNTYKITPDVFEVWMRLLRGIEGSVLWLFEGNSVAPDNLRREAKQRDVSAERLVFAARTKSEDHLARYRLADLFLDTRYYNAHTTASDALWAGLPVLTCSGATFASRVAGSLLNAVDMPELITYSLEDYEALAFKLAREPAVLSALRQKLVRDRDTFSLFDTARTTRHIEAAYTTMWERHRRGEPPESFSVAALG